MQKLTFNVIGLDNVPISKEFTLNPYVTALRGICTILKNNGHRVRLLAAEGSTADCDELLPVVLTSEIEDALGDDLNISPGPHKNRPYLIELLTARATQFLRETAKENEFLLFVSPDTDFMKTLAEKVAELKLIVCEPSIGYHEAFAPYRVFASSAWMHYNYGISHQRWQTEIFDVVGDEQAHLRTIEAPEPERRTSQYYANYDWILPHPVSPDLFEPVEKRGDYLLQLSRVSYEKGIEMAVEAAKRTGRTLKLAGIGNFEEAILMKMPPHVEYLGKVGLEERGPLIANAHCLMSWSTYIEAGSTATLEAFMSDVPVIGSLKGCYTDQIVDGVNGYKTHGIESTCEAIEKCGDLGKGKIRDFAMDYCAIDALAPKYETYFQGVYDYHTAEKHFDREYHGLPYKLD